MNSIQSTGKYTCPKCFVSFSRSNRLQSHLNRKNPCMPIEKTNDQLQENRIIPKKFKIKMKQNGIICIYCQKIFARNDNLLTHLKKNKCPQFNNLGQEVITLKKQLTEKRYFYRYYKY